MSEKLVARIFRIKAIVGVVICGGFVALLTGLIENRPEASIIGARYYGYPLVWRITHVPQTFQPIKYLYSELILNIIFWIVGIFFALIILEIFQSQLGFEYRTFLTTLLLCIPLSLVMDFIHEFGHVLWGSVVGGRFTYMQILYFEVYPRFAITSQFYLGYVRVEGLATTVKSGLFLLGGSITTNVVSWMLVLFLLRTSPGYKTERVIRILGVIGFLDLPFYVIFPQIGLKHWIIIGGDRPEPLIGARRVGIPDPLFYILVIIATLGLYFLFTKNQKK